MMSKLERDNSLGISLAATYVLARRHPVWRRRERTSGSRVERQNPSLRCEGRTPREQTSSRRSVPMLGTAAERFVVVLTARESEFERRDRVIWRLFFGQPVMG